MPITRSMRNAKKTVEDVAPKVEAPKKPRKSKYDKFFKPICEEVGIPLDRIPQFRIVSHACGGGGGPLEVKMTVKNQEDYDKLHGYLYDEKDDSVLSRAGYKLFGDCGGCLDIGADWDIVVKN